MDLLDRASTTLSSSSLLIVIQSFAIQVKKDAFPLLSPGLVPEDVIQTIGHNETDLIKRQDWYMTLGTGFNRLKEMTEDQTSEVINVEDVRVIGHVRISVLPSS